MNNKKVIVIGAGKSGIGAARLYLNHGNEVLLYDGNEKLNDSEIREKLKGTPGGLKVKLGELERSELAAMKPDLAVVSPGVPLENPVVLNLRQLGVKVIGELEAAYQASKGDVIAVTGTNGKTTTVSLLGEILSNYARKTGNRDKVIVAGNIGTAFTGTAEGTTEQSLSVLEVSSFQLETIEQFHPVISAILNITPDHLNRHHTMENYIAAKERITLNQTEEDTVVLNYDDPILREFGEKIRVKAFFFTKSADFPKDTPHDFIYLDGDSVCYRGESLFSVKETKLLGVHNYENIMAACAVAIRYGVPFDVIRETVRNFKAVEHRIEYVDTISGIYYYNDSKGTNPDASIKAVLAMDRPAVLICGGYDKQVSFDDFVRSFQGKVRSIVLIGETADQIEEAARRYGFHEIRRAGSLKEAVTTASGIAKEGDAVLLSPACASWDMFQNYEERGRLFKEYVKGLRA